MTQVQYTQSNSSTSPSSDCPTIAVVLACFNRRDTTLRCLTDLYSLQDQNFHIDIYLLDDASTDGTEMAVREKFPQVVVLKGTGQLYWGGGMSTAMAEAMKRPFDFILLLNDDVSLSKDALVEALSNYAEVAERESDPRQIIVGATTSPAGDSITYSGFGRTSRWDPSRIKRIPPDAHSLKRCDTMNGNFVLIPRQLARELGPVDRAFVHQLGDLDYGYRAVAKGAGIWICKRPVGVCEANNRVMPFERPGLNILQRWKALNSPLGLPLRPWLIFMWRHGGFLALIKLAGMYSARMLNR